MWKNRFVIHIPVGKLLQLYIFDFDALFSCQWKLHMMHIFLLNVPLLGELLQSDILQKR